MISSKFVNELFNAIAGLVNQLTGKNIQFEKIEYGSLQEAACDKVNRFSKAMEEAISAGIVINQINSLEPGKMYCLQIDETSENLGLIENIARGLADQGILLVVIGQDMKFVSVPEGYEVKTKSDDPDTKTKSECPF